MYRIFMVLFIFLFSFNCYSAEFKNKGAELAFKKLMDVFPYLTKQGRQNAYNDFVKLYHEPVDPVDIKDAIETGYYKFYTDPVTGMEFIKMKGGCYMMGDTFGDGFSGEKPVHEVCVDDFYMGKYEVTNAQYRKFKSDHNSGDYLNSDNQPVVGVSWYDAKAFARWLSDKTGKRYRLPTEAEWEYAAKSGTNSRNYWGNDNDSACSYANVHDYTSKAFDDLGLKTHNCSDGYAVTAPVGKFKPNSFGLYDMIGNVSEWVEDVYSYSAYSSHSRNNPIYTYTGNGNNRVVRGGSWYSPPIDARASSRNFHMPVSRYGDIGFRLVLDVSK